MVTVKNVNELMELHSKLKFLITISTHSFFLDVRFNLLGLIHKYKLFYFKQQFLYKRLQLNSIII